MKEYMAKAVEGKVFSEQEAYEAMGVIMSGGATPAQIAGFLIALRMRGEKSEEIAGFARAMAEKALKVKAPEGSIDTCGTGGDRSHTLNLSTAAALVAAALGVPVAKHGNRSVSSSCGSADVLPVLGVPVENPPEKAERLLEDVGFAFLFAPLYHPAMKHAIGPRRELGVRTVFNILGPLTSPADVKRQAMGVFSPDWLEPLARALVALGRDRAVVFHGEPGLDEISPCGRTRYLFCEGGEVVEGETTPRDLGMEDIPLDALKVSSAEESAAKITSAFEGKDDEAAGAIAVNAGFALWVAGRADSPKDGTAMARDGMSDGACTQYMERLRAAGD